jgi:hypothetical protein
VNFAVLVTFPDPKINEMQQEMNLRQWLYVPEIGKTTSQSGYD